MLLSALLNPKLNASRRSKTLSRYDEGNPFTTKSNVSDWEEKPRNLGICSYPYGISALPPGCYCLPIRSSGGNRFLPHPIEWNLSITFCEVLWRWILAMPLCNYITASSANYPFSDNFGLNQSIGTRVAEYRNRILARGC